MSTKYYDSLRPGLEEIVIETAHNGSGHPYMSLTIFGMYSSASAPLEHDEIDQLIKKLKSWKKAHKV